MTAPACQSSPSRVSGPATPRRRRTYPSPNNCTPERLGALLASDAELSSLLPLIRGAKQLLDGDEADLVRKMDALGHQALSIVQANCAALDAASGQLGALISILQRARMRLVRFAQPDRSRGVREADGGCGYER